MKDLLAKLKSLDNEKSIKSTINNHNPRGLMIEELDLYKRISDGRTSELLKDARLKILNEKFDKELGFLQYIVESTENTPRKIIKTLRGNTEYSRFLHSEENIQNTNSSGGVGYVSRKHFPDIKTPYSSGTEFVVYLYNGRNVIAPEVRHGVRCLYLVPDDVTVTAKSLDECDSTTAGDIASVNTNLFGNSVVSRKKISEALTKEESSAHFKQYKLNAAAAKAHEKAESSTADDIKYHPDLYKNNTFNPNKYLLSREAIEKTDEAFKNEKKFKSEILGYHNRLYKTTDIKTANYLHSIIAAKHQMLAKLHRNMWWNSKTPEEQKQYNDNANAGAAWYMMGRK